MLQEKINKKNKVFVGILLIIIFLFSFGVHYSLYEIKGFSQIEYFNLLIAKNWAETGELSYENAENVVLSTENIKINGVPTNLGNKLTFYLYGSMFRVFGFHPDLPIYTSFVLYSLAVVFIFLIVNRAFNLKTGLTAVLLMNSVPFVLPYSQLVGRHEWAWFFMILAAFFYFWPKKRKYQYLVLSGLFLGLSAATRNSFLVVFPAFFIMELWQYRKSTKLIIQRELILLFSFLIIILPLIGNNAYIKATLGISTGEHYESFTNFVHLFPDPYTFHYEKNIYIDELITNKNSFSGGEFRLWGDLGSFLDEYGYDIGFFKGEIITRAYSLFIYLKGLFLSLIVFGGILTWFLIFIGFRELVKKKEYIFPLFGIIFFICWLILLVFLKTSNYTHLLALSLPITILMSYGLVRLSEIISDSITFKKIKPSFISWVIVLIFVIMFAQISWWTIRELSANSGLKNSLINFSKTELKKSTIDWSEVTMVGYSKEETDLLTYYLNQNFIFFDEETVKKLAEERKLNSVLKEYNISGYIGFDDKTSEIIKKNSGDLKEYKIY
ncbi:MAG: glycosyltransferase family 39 protein [Candidatus Zambryskibacteria bacterium]|nr:glycosyltransferase family 39 protein [Candidatus Zambryskibacteria bacterium]